MQNCFRKAPFKTLDTKDFTKGWLTAANCRSIGVGRLSWERWHGTSTRTWGGWTGSGIRTGNAVQRWFTAAPRRTLTSGMIKIRWVQMVTGDTWSGIEVRGRLVASQRVLGRGWTPSARSQTWQENHLGVVEGWRLQWLIIAIWNKNHYIFVL